MRIIATTIVMLALGQAIIADIVWPADGAWTALTIGSNLYSDVASEINPAAVDLVGTLDSYSAGYWALNEAFMIRMRLRDTGEQKNFVWQALLDTDGDASSIEWIFQLVRSGSDNGVELIRTTVGGPTLGDIATESNYAWHGDEGIYSRWIPAPNSTDYHLDFAIPWSDFSLITSITNTVRIRIVLSTSASHNQINKDAPLGGSLDQQISNAISDGIPEPAVATLLICAGSGMIVFRRLFGAKSSGCSTF